MKRERNAFTTPLLLLLPMAATFYFLEHRALSLFTLRSLHIPIPDGTGNAGVSVHDSSQISRVLPVMKETGGLIVFLHVAKTGGTTIRDDFAEFEDVRVRRVLDEEHLKRPVVSKMIDSYLSPRNKNGKNGNGQTLLLEIHGGKGETMTVFEMHSYIQRWRAKAVLSNKNIFVFTMLREPTAFYVSHFNFFKHMGCRWAWCDPPLMELTEDNLLTSMVPNHQCQYLARKNFKKQNRALPVTKSECDSVYEVMKTDVDWIGTTEDMQSATLPLLSFLLTGNAERGRGLKIQNKQKQNRKTLSLRDLSETALHRIQQASVLDRNLYTRVREDFSIDMWENFN